MEIRGVVVLFAALAVSACLAETEVTFVEVLRERAGSSRIVSGWEAEDGQLPFQFSLRMVSPTGGVSSCGGSVIHSEWGLTAAHCTAGRVSFVIRAGVVNLTLPYNIFETTEFLNHPLYNENIPSVVQPHDIGVIKFGRILEFNDLVQPIRLQRSASKDVDYEGVQLIASGWGRTWTNGASPENLNWVYLSGVTNLRCVAQYGAIIVDSTICASGYNVSSQSTCQGDSGGPLTVVDDDGAISQVGISSFVSGTGCHTDFPAGFIRPGHYHDWYLEVTGINLDWEYDAPTTEAPTTEDSTTEDSTTEDPTTEDPTTEDPATEVTTTEDPTSSEEVEEELDCEDEEDEEATPVHFVN